MKPLDTHNVEYLEQLYKQVRRLDLGPLLSGLTILVKDTSTYLTAHGIDDPMAEGFRAAYLGMLNNNRYYWQHFGPELYRTLKDAGLPEGFASGASNCEPNLLEPLTDGGLEAEWLRPTGWHFFETYSAQRRGDILGDKTLEELKVSLFETKDSDKSKGFFCEDKDPFEPIGELVDRLAGSERQSRAFWYPVMLYLALLLHKTHLTTLE